MSKTKTSVAEAQRTGETQAAKPKPADGDGLRETIESVVVAFVLAFLFRTFEAEAFVIPTGSMAPTLMGRHKDLECEKCGYAYRVSASEEVNDDGARLVYKDTNKPTTWIDSSTCPMCRYPMDLDGPGRPDLLPSYKGDRIIVGKFPYEFGEPKRWDVIVFKYPERAQINFIKRLVGLPGETIWIVHGDIYTRQTEQQRFQIARKHPMKLQAMLQMVYDNDYVVPSMLEAGWPARWQAWPVPVEKLYNADWATARPVLTDSASLPPGHWKTDDQRSFQTDGTAAEPVWLRYQHTVPAAAKWERMEAGEPVTAEALLIEDFNAYNDYTTNKEGHPGTPPQSGHDYPHWVGDLFLECELEVRSEQGVAIFELVEGGVRFQCRVDVATGEATLTSEALPDFKPAAKTEIRGPGVYRLAFSNIDNELLLWVNGEVVQFDAPTTYDSHAIGNTKPRDADYAPVGIASEGAALEVDRLVIMRDLYYLASGEFVSDNPDGEQFELEQDQFFVLGDNSARSMDSRMWRRGERFVHRDLLIGKALLIYWPHSWNQIPGTEIPFPFYPNFARMGLVR